MYFVVLHTVKQTNYLMIFLGARARERERVKKKVNGKKREAFFLLFYSKNDEKFQ